MNIQTIPARAREIKAPDRFIFTMTWVFVRILILVFFLSSFMTTTSAQEQFLISDGEVQTVKALEEQYQDFIMPEALNGFDQLILEAEGADGGWIEYTYYDRFSTKRTRRINGGEGATVSATYAVGDYGQPISPGAILRFIIGNRGQYAKFDLMRDGNFGAGGGGGTAILLSKDGGVSWQLLMVAGGGGGAGVNISKDNETRKFHPGQPGSLHEHGKGGVHNEFSMAEGGMQGNGGDSHPENGGGGGAHGNGQHEEGVLYYGNAGWKDYKLSEPPLGGLGGTQKDCQNGGWGFGGGGSGKEGGGGGGGYSGGGAGLDGYGGGGGGSFVDVLSISATNVSKMENGNTDNPGDGYVRYKFTKN